MLTARGQEADKIRGLDAGADDYVTKPFSIGELVARIRAIFRRHKRPQRGRRELRDRGRATVNVGSTHRHTRRQASSASFYEVELLRLLHERQGSRCRRDEILNSIWGIEANPSNRTVDNFIVKLRKKVENDRDKPQHILTVYGYGYKLVV